MIDYESNWWPSSDLWPEAKGDFLLFHEQAVALLLLNENLVILAHKGKPVLMVNCSDVFAWGCADAEDIPCLGFNDEEEKPFWELYELVRKNPKWGSTQWTILKRQLRPQLAVEKLLKEDNSWLPEFEEFKRAVATKKP